MDSSTEDIDARHGRNAELYNALMIDENQNKVIELCSKVPDHALHILTVHDDTVLHMATYSKKSELVLSLLEKLPDNCLDKMTRQNKAGNTILHATATSDHALPVVNELLKKAPGLLGMRNNSGETALYHSARCGKTDIFLFLADKIRGYDQVSKQSFLQRGDKTTALHICVLFHHFELALQIAKDHQFLINEKDTDGLTSLQLLSLKPEAFKLKHGDGFLKKLINSVKYRCSSTRRETIEKEKPQYESAIQLAKLLIQKDTSWEDTVPIQDKRRPRIHRYGFSTNISSHEKGIREGREIVIDPPLLQAAKSGCIHIVKEILKVYPQAIGYINNQGRNILHVAIKNRQLEIFEFLKKMEIPMRQLAGKVDDEGNTMLHMVGKRRKDYVSETVEGPGFVLQAELLWYERVKEVTVPHFLNHQNNKKFTAEGLFALTHNELRLQSKEWIKRTAEGCSVNAVLISTVAFAVAYTVPGGSDEKTGFPILINHPFFVVFTISDVCALTLSLASVVTFLSILASPFRFQDFKHSLPNKLTLGFTFMFLSVTMMMVAFVATVVLMIKNKESWAKVALYTFSFIPIGIFALSYFPRYITTSTSRACKYLREKTKQLIPRNILVPLKKICCLSNRPKPGDTTSFIP